MNEWAKTALSATVSGSIASVITAAALSALSRAEGRGALQPINATSHWLHGDQAARVRNADASHTLVGFGTHHASAIFWALPFEAWLANGPPRAPGRMLAEAAGMAAIAAAVDYGLTPKRLTPGWEEVLPLRSMAAAYGALAVGLAAGALLTQSMRAGGVETEPRRYAEPGSPGVHMHNHRDHHGAGKLYELIDEIRICMMTTGDDAGRLHSRPMYSLKPDAAGDLWFFTRISSPKVSELGPDGRVNLAFAHPGKQHYVSVSGQAEIVRDRELIHEKWAEPMRAWFPDGRDDPQLALVRVHPESGEYWDSPSSAVVHLYGYVKAAVTGEPPHELSDNEKVNLL